MAGDEDYPYEWTQTEGTVTITFPLEPARVALRANGEDGNSVAFDIDVRSSATATKLKLRCGPCVVASGTLHAPLKNVDPHVDDDDDNDTTSYTFQKRAKKTWPRLFKGTVGGGGGGADGDGDGDGAGGGGGGGAASSSTTTTKKVVCGVQ